MNLFLVHRERFTQDFQNYNKRKMFLPPKCNITGVHSTRTPCPGQNFCRMVLIFFDLLCSLNGQRRVKRDIVSDKH